MFCRPAVVLGPPLGLPAASPQQAVALLRQNEGLAIVDERPVEILGRWGIQVDIVASHADTPVLGEGGAFLGLGPDSDLRLLLLQADEGILAVGLLSPVGELERWVADAQPVVESVLLAP